MAGETPYEWVRRRRQEGASVDALAAELARTGMGTVEIDRLLDRDVRPTVESVDSLGRGGMASPQLLFGVLLLIGGLVLLLGGWARGVVLLIFGVGRLATAWGVERPSPARQDEARHAMIERALDESQQRCALHLEYAARGTCPRCGSFCCALCSPGRGFGGGRVCMKCQALPELQSARRRNASRGAALTLLSAPATIVLLLALERVITAENASPAQRLALLVGASAPWLVLAVLQAVARSAWPVVVSVVPWLFVGVSLAIGAGRMAAALWLIPLAFAFYGWVSIRQAAQGQPAFIIETTPPA